MTEGRLTPHNADLWAHNVLACDVLQLSQNGASSPGRMNVQICSTNIEIGIPHWHTLQLSRCAGVWVCGCVCVLSYLPYARVPLKRLIISACCSAGSPGRKSQWDVHDTQCKAPGMGQRGMHPARPCLHHDCLSLHAAPVWVCVCVSQCKYSAVEQSTFHLQCAVCSKQQAPCTVAEVKRLLNGEAAKCKCCL